MGEQVASHKIRTIQLKFDMYRPGWRTGDDEDKVHYVDAGHCDNIDSRRKLMLAGLFLRAVRIYVFEK